jgi:insulysin
MVKIRCLGVGLVNLAAIVPSAAFISSILSSAAPSRRRTFESIQSRVPFFTATSDELDITSVLDSADSNLSNIKSLILASDEDFVKPDLDKRQYRAIKLPNNLEVLLVSDKNTDIEAAAVHIKAGHFNDPEDRAGLAHFNEHMLFLGTEKYPEENAFDSFVNKNGGSSNAYTDMEDTNYYFSVSPLDHNDEDDEVDCDDESETGDDEYEAGDDEYDEESGGVSLALSGALDRFAQFFISPLFSEDAVERELRAIDSEHLNSFSSDSWRTYLLLKSSCNQTHPFSKFGCGNYATLTNGGNVNGTDAVSSGGTSPRDELIKFWKDNYVAEKMKVCVVGRADLDDLQSLVEQSFAGVRSSGVSDKQHLREDEDVIFKKEYSKYGVAFGPEQLGIIREYVPLVDERSIKFLFACPPADDPAIFQTRPDRVLSHLLGHEGPGSLHALLLEEGLVNTLSSGLSISTSDFGFCSISLQVTPKGMEHRDRLISLVWQWINLIKTAVYENEELMIAYHDELSNISKFYFKFRENGDPTDFVSSVAEGLFEYEPSKILLGTSDPAPYNASVTKAFLDRLRPDNCLLQMHSQDFENETAGSFDVSAASAEWQYEKWYKAKYRQIKVSDELLNDWSSKSDPDPRLRLPGMNTFLPTDFSLRSEDPDSVAEEDPSLDYTKVMPKLLIDEPGIQLWHKMDRTFKVPKTAIRMLLVTPNVYISPRSMTLNRIFIKVLEDDLNSHIYDASLAGCKAKVTCLPSGISVSVTGFSEKLPMLLDAVMGRMLSIVHDLKDADESSALARTVDKATKNLLRETKNFRLESPYETASYISRLILEHNVWHVSNYIAELEGPFADKNPVTPAELANLMEEVLTSRLSATFLCMGNINEEGARNVVKLINDHFLHNARPLQPEEIPKLRSLKVPTKEEAVKIFGPEVGSRSIPLILEEIAHSEAEENSAVEVILQADCEHEMGYEGVAIMELIGQMAYTSAYTQLRTKEQLGYIAGAFTRKTAGGSMGLSVMVQSSTTLPADLEARCEAWVTQFREELEQMKAGDLANEALAIIASLLERNMKFSDEVSTAWSNIVSTTVLGTQYNAPPFYKYERLVKELVLKGMDIEAVGGDALAFPESERQTPEELKQKVLEMWDRYFAAGAPERKAISARVYGRKAIDEYNQNVGKCGYLSSYDDVRQLKQFFSQYPTAPYWIARK